MADDILVGALRRGDEAAFESLYRTWYPRLVRLADAKLRQRALAEDLAQEVMLELWRRKESLAPDTSLAAWLCTSVGNRVLSVQRHDVVARRVEPQVEHQFTPAAHADADLLHAEIDDALQSALQAMPDRPREVFLLNRIHGLTYGEIARSINMSQKTIEADMGKALRLLRERLAPWLAPRTVSQRQ